MEIAKISKPQHLNTSIYYNKYKKMEKQNKTTIREIKFNRELSKMGWNVIAFNESQIRKTFSCRMYKVFNIYIKEDDIFTKEDLIKWYKNLVK